MKLPGKVGDLLRLNEADYLYGTGALVLRVTEAPEVVPGQEWLEIRGIEIAWNGERLGERCVHVRVAALARPPDRA